MRRARPNLSRPPAVGSTPGEVLIDLGTALVAFGDALKLVGARLPANQIAPAVSAQIPAPGHNAAGSGGLPVEGFVRIWDILGRGAARGRSATLGVIPVCRATWYAGIKSGRFPKPIKHGGAAMWRVEEIRAPRTRNTSMYFVSLQPVHCLLRGFSRSSTPGEQFKPHRATRERRIFAGQTCTRKRAGRCMLVDPTRLASDSSTIYCRAPPAHMRFISPHGRMPSTCVSNFTSTGSLGLVIL